MIDLKLRMRGLVRIWRIGSYVFVAALATFARQNCQADVFGHGDNTFAIEFVTIGNPGNTPDLDNNPASYQGHPGATPVGGVDYEYRIGKYEITREYVDKANALGNLGITMLDMTQVGLNLLDATANEPELPATGINWFEAAKFVNWLNVNVGQPEAYKVRNGEFYVWEPTDAGYDPTNIFRNRLAHYFLPSVHEWYKAAFYDGQKDVYYEFATGSDTPPARVANGTAADSAVYHRRKPAPSNQAGGLSPYGTMGQGGNVWEWEETEYDHVNRDIIGMRGLRSGDWGTDAQHISADYRNPFPPHIENQLKSFGFRVASIAQPIVRGDFNGNGVLDAADIDRLTVPSADLSLDLTHDGLVNNDDRIFWVHRLARTWFGDVNLDGQFTSKDLVQVFEKGQYEDAIDGNSGWEAGDWNGDGNFTTGDLIAAFQDGGYDQGPRPNASAVPEPSGLSLLLLTIMGLSLRRRNAD